MRTSRINKNGKRRRMRRTIKKAMKVGIKQRKRRKRTIKTGMRKKGKAGRRL